MEIAGIILEFLRPWPLEVVDFPSDLGLNHAIQGSRRGKKARYSAHLHDSRRHNPRTTVPKGSISGEIQGPSKGHRRRAFFTTPRACPPTVGESSLRFGNDRLVFIRFRPNRSEAAWGSTAGEELGTHLMFAKIPV